MFSKIDAAVWRMIAGIVGPDILWKSIQGYVKNVQKLTSTDQFYDEFQNIVDKFKIKLPAKVKDLFDPWFNENMHAIVRVSRPTGNISEIEISKMRGSAMIPITVSTAANANFTQIEPHSWLNASTITLKIDPIVTSDQWVILNNQALGYYRVQYDAHSWNLLVNALRNGPIKNIHVLNRAQLINDAAYFTKMNQMSSDKLFNLLLYLNRETDSIPWFMAELAFELFERRLRSLEVHEHLEEMIRNITAAAYDTVNISNQSESDRTKRLLRQYAGKLACEAGLQKCVKDVELLIEKVVRIISSIPSNDHRPDSSHFY